MKKNSTDIGNKFFQSTSERHLDLNKLLKKNWQKRSKGKSKNKKSKTKKGK